jgi:hypothetical protein
MKRFLLFIIVTILFFGFVSSTNAQKGTSYILFGMPQRTFMYGKSDRENAAIIAQTHLPEEPREIKKTPSYNFAMGFFIVKSYTKKIALRFGCSLAAHEQYYETYMKIENTHVKSSIRLKYLKFPICIQYNYWVDKKYKLFFSCGPQLNALISENGTFPFFGYNKYLPSLDMIDPGDAYKNFVLGGMATVGAEFKFDDRVSLVLAPYIDATFTAVEKKSFINMAKYYMNQPFEYPNVTIRTKSNIAVGINVGLSFFIKGAGDSVNK